MQENDNLNLPTAAEVAAKTGLDLKHAQQRLRNVRRGLLAQEYLLAPKGALPSAAASAYKAAGLPAPTELAAMTGITPSSANNRLRSFLRGIITREMLFAPKGMRRDASPAWRDLGLGPRRNLDDIPGETPLERIMRRQEAA